MIDFIVNKPKQLKTQLIFLFAHGAGAPMDSSFMIRIVEGVSLIFTGLLCGTITYINYADWISQIVFFISAIYLFAMAVVSLFTGFKVNFLPFKLCPFIFSLSAIFLILGAVL